VILALNTAEETLQILLTGPDEGPGGFSGGLFDPHGFETLEFFEEHCPGRMNEVLAPAVKALLDRRPGRALQGVACVRGPGSFTGVRLGLAFATGLCLAHGTPMAGLDHLPLLALRAPRGFAEVHVVAHSRSAQVYHQAFGPGAAPFSTPRDVSLVQARELLRHAVAERSEAARAAVLGSGVARHPEVFADIPGLTVLDAQVPTAGALLRATLAARFDGPTVDALYLRGSDAEENLEAISAARGLSKEEALSRMERAMRDA